MSTRRLVAFLLIVVCVLASASAAALAPRKLYLALMTRSFPDRALPPGYTNANPFAGVLNSAEIAHAAAGGVDVDVTSADEKRGGFIRYVVYASAAKARFEITSIRVAPGFRKLGGVRGYSQPSLEVTGAVAGSTRTDALLLVGNTFVLARGLTSDTSQTAEHDTVVAAKRLLDAAVAHLRAIKRSG